MASPARGRLSLDDLALYAIGVQCSFRRAGEFAKLRAGIGADWPLFGWLEVSPRVMGEGRGSLPLRTIAMGQLHLVY